MAFLVPWILVCAVTAGLIAVVAQVATMRAARAARVTLDREVAGDVVVLRGRLRVEGDGCEGRWGDKRKIAAHSFVHSRRRAWPKQLHIAGTRVRCARLWLDTDRGPVLIEGPVGVEVGSRIRFSGDGLPGEGGKWFGGEAIVFDGDEVVATGTRQAAASIRPRG